MSTIPSPKSKVALVLGSTGAVGKCIVPRLLMNGWTVYTLGRRPWDITSASNFAHKDRFTEPPGALTQIVSDTDAIPDAVLNNVDKLKDVTAIFNAFGTTRATAGSAAEFIRVDHDIPVAVAANLIKAVPSVSHAAVISSQGANSSSLFTYMKTKGRVEDDYAALPFSSVSVFRPGFLNRGADTQARLGERFFRWFTSGIDVDAVAAAAVVDAESRLAASPPAAPARVARYGNCEIRSLISSV